jgi:hypothetical protein
MSFRKTGNMVEQAPREETLQFCDQCDKQLSVNSHNSVDHWEVRLDRQVRYPDDDEMGYDLCSLECLAAWAQVTPLRRTKAGKRDAW